MTNARALAGLRVDLPGPDGALIAHELREPGAFSRPDAPFTVRRVYAAAHVVPRMLADNVPGAAADVDWDATLDYRRELWSWGFGVADAMDTAQRGMGMDWAATAELIQRSADAARDALATGAPVLAGRDVRDLLACGAGTDQLDLDAVAPGEDGLAAVLAAYREQLAVVESAGAKSVLMASRALARVARGPEDYLAVYGTLLAETAQPVILHWLGDVFDPALAGYWGSDDVSAATETFLELIRSNPSAVDGVKVSLLDAEHEVALRAALPAGVRLYTGDDFNYPELIHGDGERHSDALLGIFSVIYPAASAALQRYEAGDADTGRAILDTTRALGLHIFEAPTYYYKTGVAFLAWLNGHQRGFQMVGGLHAGRSIPHLVEIFRLADEAGLLRDPALAAERMRGLLATGGAL